MDETGVVRLPNVAFPALHQSGSEPPEGCRAVRQGRGTVAVPHGRQHGSNMRHGFTLFGESPVIQIENLRQRDGGHELPTSAYNRFQGVSMPFSSLGGESRCRDCGGSGDCQQCFGSGRNVALNSDQDKCPNCGGTGRCPTCADTGIITLGISDS